MHTIYNLLTVAFWYMKGIHPNMREGAGACALPFPYLGGHALYSTYVDKDYYLIPQALYFRCLMVDCYALPPVTLWLNTATIKILEHFYALYFTTNYILKI